MNELVEACALITVEINVSVRFSGDSRFDQNAPATYRRHQ